MSTRRDFLISAAVSALAAKAESRPVQVGVCGSLDDFPKAVEYGFDYYEPAAAAIAALTDVEFAAFRDRVLASPIRCECFNSFIRTLRVVGDDVNPEALASYVSSSLDRCRQVGATIVVWGSAGSRNVAAGYSRETAWRQIVEFLGHAGDIARSKQIVIAIEPLRKQESNIINSGAEALRLVRDVRHPNVKMIIDYYHLREESEDPEILKTARDEIVHLHFANPNGRVWPKQVNEDPVYGRFFELVKQIQFRGGISIEGKGTFEADARASLAFFKKALS
jgi:D-psicose/D-tagatose/L-ribulose 3-epimerase